MFIKIFTNDVHFNNEIATQFFSEMSCELQYGKIALSCNVEESFKNPVQYFIVQVYICGRNFHEELISSNMKLLTYRQTSAA